jgi:hypothetical protein
MSPNDPDPILRISRYLAPTIKSPFVDPETTADRHRNTDYIFSNNLPAPAAVAQVVILMMFVSFSHTQCRLAKTRALYR